MRKRYRFLSKKGEGTFSEVLKAKSIATNELVATKCMKEHFSSIDEVNNLREIQALKRLNPHENIINLYEVVFEKKSGRLTLVFELMDMNLYQFIRKTNGYIKPPRVMRLMYQLLRAIDHIHKRGIFHRDIKPENILIAATKTGDKLKLADFGSCRGKYSKQPFTEYISTRWYRAPECLLTDGWYDSKMDIWGVGCVFFEITALFPLFPGTNELDQIERIHRVLGTPNVKLLESFKKRSSHIRFDFKIMKGAGIAPLIPHADREAISLITQLLIYDPKRRITGYQSLKHRYFDRLYELEKKTGSINGKVIGIGPLPSAKKLKATLSSSALPIPVQSHHDRDDNSKLHHPKSLKASNSKAASKANSIANSMGNSEKHSFKIEGTTKAPSIKSHSKYRKSKHSKHRNKDEVRRRKRSFRANKYEKYQQQKQQQKQKHSTNHNHHRMHHHRERDRDRKHRHKMKKNEHSRTQIKLPKVKKLKRGQHTHSEKKKTSMIGLAKLQHAQSTSTLSTSFNMGTNNDLLSTMMKAKKYGHLQRIASFKEKLIPRNKKLPPVHKGSFTLDVR